MKFSCWYSIITWNVGETVMSDVREKNPPTVTWYTIYYLKQLWLHGLERTKLVHIQKAELSAKFCFQWLIVPQLHILLMPAIMYILSKQAWWSVKSREMDHRSLLSSQLRRCMWLCLLLHRHWCANTSVLRNWRGERPFFWGCYTRLIVSVSEQKLFQRLACFHLKINT